MLAATVWPTSTLREMTRPSIGAVITVCSRFTWLWFTDASDWVIAACTWVTVACCDWREACAMSTAVFEVSRSLCGRRLRAESCCAREYFCWVSTS